MTTLYLCEKPSQAKDIASVLGASSKKNGYYEKSGQQVTWCFGHLLEMANPDDYDAGLKRWAFHTLPIVPEHWELRVKSSAAKQYKIIQGLVRNASKIVISTDADREGEMIAREILQLCNYQGSIERLWLSALDPTSIRKALSALLPGDETQPLYQAGLARSRADWLVGMNMTRAYTLLFKQAGADKIVSIGRVQTPTLNLVVQRDRVIEKFVPVPYFDLLIDCDAQGSVYKAKWMPEHSDAVSLDQENRCLSRGDAAHIAQAIAGQPGKIVDYQQHIKEEHAPLPLDLSSLQIAASKHFGLDANQVLEAAQALYETHKATTYPRTDCRYLPLSQFEESGAVIDAIGKSDTSWLQHHKNALAPDQSIKSRCWDDSKITAHHAIIPTAAVFDIRKLSESEVKVYDLIRKHYIAQFFPKYRYEAIVCKTEVQSHSFISHGRTDLNPGWRAILKESQQEQDDDNQKLPALHEGQAIRVINTQLFNKQTKPPARFTSGTLIAAMKNAGRSVDNPALRKVLRETSGIGTEATRANIIDTLFERDYLTKKGKHVISTEFGREVIDAVPDVLKDPATTALWEQILDEIGKQQATLDGFMDKQINFIQQMIDYLSKMTISLNYPAPKQHECPKCGSALRLIRPKKGKSFWSCSRYPECTETFPNVKGAPGTKKAASGCRSAKELKAGQSCPECSTGNLSQKTIKSGKNAGKPFIGCSSYPKCKAFSWVKST